MASDIGSHRRCSTTSRDSRLVIGLERVFAFHGGRARGTPSIRSLPPRGPRTASRIQRLPGGVH
ncbi:hypothetical protein BGW80DRAFT_1321700, partial [Lactifluus volemus]